MDIFEILFDEKTLSLVKNGGCANKAEMFACLMKGDRTALCNAIEQYLKSLKVIFPGNPQEDLDMLKKLLKYGWFQTMALSESGGLSEECCAEFMRPYFFEVERAESIEAAEELCKNLMLEYFDIYSKQHEQSGYSPQVQDCINFIRKNIKEKLSIQIIADEFHFSQSYISHKFKEETGKTVNQFILAERVHEAELMLNCNLPITMISQELQFSSQSHFTDVFKKHTGKTPNQFRKQAQIKARGS